MMRYWLKSCLSPEIKLIKIVYNFLNEQVDRRSNIKKTRLQVLKFIITLMILWCLVKSRDGKFKNISMYFKAKNKRQFLSDVDRTITRIINGIVLSGNIVTWILSLLRHSNCYRIQKSLTRLILSLHRLQIETGRWNKPHIIPINELKCKLCNTLEDEYHYVIECPIYSDLRKHYIKRDITRMLLLKCSSRIIYILLLTFKLILAIQIDVKIYLVKYVSRYLIVLKSNQCAQLGHNS